MRNFFASIRTRLRSDVARTEAAAASGWKTSSPFTDVGAGLRGRVKLSDEELRELRGREVSRPTPRGGPYGKLDSVRRLPPPETFSAIYSVFGLPSTIRLADAAEFLSAEKFRELTRLNSQFNRLNRKIATLSWDALSRTRKESKMRIRAGREQTGDAEKVRDPHWFQMQVKLRRDLKAQLSATEGKVRPLLSEIAQRIESLASSLIPEIEKASRSEFENVGGDPTEWTPSPLLMQIGRATWLPSEVCKLGAIVSPRRFLRQFSIEL